MHRKSKNYIDKIRLLFRKDKEPFLKLYDIMGFYPHDISIYTQALMHRSCRQRSGSNRVLNNERLEFLGDALLSAVVADVLYERFQGQQEGFLTTLRSKIVKRETLNELAVNIGLDKLVKHSDHVGNAHNSYMNGNAFEAFFAAIYLDRGYDYCMQFMKERIFTKYIDIDKMSAKEENFKSKLIEWCQHYQCKFDFIVTAEKNEGGNAPKFFSEVLIEGVSCGKGTGYSKKESHQQAAQSAYKKVRSNVGFVNQLMEMRNNRVNGNTTTAYNPSKPAATKPATDKNTKQADKTAKPTERPTKPTERPTKPAERPTKPAERPAKPAEQAAKPAEKPAKPAEKPAKPATVKPSGKPAKQAGEQPAEQPKSTTENPEKTTARRRRPSARRQQPTPEAEDKTKQAQ